MLRIRIHEIETLARIGNVNVASEFVQSAVGNLVQPARNAVEFVRNPVAAVERMPEGVWNKTFGRMGGFFHHDSGSSAYTQGDIVSGLYSSNVRAEAVKLGFDPYTTNPKVQSLLRELGQANALGEVAATVTPTPAVVGYTSAALSTQEEIKQTIATMSPSDIDAANDRVFAALGIPAHTRRAFAGSTWLSPTHKVVIATAVKGMRDVRNLGAVLVAAAEATDEKTAVMHALQATMLAAFHHRYPLRSLDVVGAVVVATTRSNGIVVLLPMDSVYWTQQVDQASRALLALPQSRQAGSRTIYCTGEFSPRAKSELEQRGFRVFGGVKPPATRLTGQGDGSVGR
ncbi:MAG: hypothetical protein ACYTG6_16300 [Planctomycetota bacterium]